MTRHLFFAITLIIGRRWAPQLTRRSSRDKLAVRGQKFRLRGEMCRPLGRGRRLARPSEQMFVLLRPTVDQLCNPRDNPLALVDISRNSSELPLDASRRFGWIAPAKTAKAGGFTPAGFAVFCRVDLDFVTGYA
jgi:hypothetical protein